MTHPKLTHGESETGVDEAVDKVWYRQTLKREVGGHFSENVHDTVDNEGHDEVAHEQRGGSNVR